MSYGFSVISGSGHTRLGTTDTIYRLHSVHVVSFSGSLEAETKYVSIPGYNPDSGGWVVYYSPSRAISVVEQYNQLKVDFRSSGSLTFGGSIVLKVAKK